MTADTKNPDVLFDAIRSRRSIGLKKLLPDPIDLGLVSRMLEAANWAPSHGKTEPWRFVVFSGDSREIVSNALGEAYRLLNVGDRYSQAAEQSMRQRPSLAPVWIALGMHPDPKRPEWEELVAFACAVQNAQLMASALGLGCKWTSGPCSVHPHVAEAVGFGPATRFLGFLYVGRPSVAWPESQRRPLAEKVRWAGSTVPRLDLSPASE